jgi:iron complex outermembrane receptor protein
MNNELTNKMLPLDIAETSKNFNNISTRIGTSYSFNNAINVFADWSQGFMPPSTEELSSNPEGYSGFNTHLVPATSNCSEIGLRGFYKDKISYEITGFMMHTENDFFRFKQSGRGNQEVFYGNAGNSRRYGIETYISINLIKNLNLQVAYTFADYKYTSAEIDPVYTDPEYVMTTPPAPGQWLPNSPKHQIYSQFDYLVTKNIRIILGMESQSKWAIYTDSNAYSGLLDPAIYQNWQEGFIMYHTGVVYNWEIWKLKGECNIFLRNLTGTQYMAFTEPDPDGNSYQPGPERELIVSIKLRF